MRMWSLWEHVARCFVARQAPWSSRGTRDLTLTDWVVCVRSFAALRMTMLLDRLRNHTAGELVRRRWLRVGRRTRGPEVCRVWQVGSEAERLLPDQRQRDVVDRRVPEARP